MQLRTRKFTSARAQGHCSTGARGHRGAVPVHQDRLPCSLVSIPGSPAWDRAFARSWVCGNSALLVPARTPGKPLIKALPSCPHPPVLDPAGDPEALAGSWEVSSFPERDMEATRYGYPHICAHASPLHRWHSLFAHPSYALWLGNIFLSSVGWLPLIL